MPDPVDFFVQNAPISWHFIMQLPPPYILLPEKFVIFPSLENKFVLAAL